MSAINALQTAVINRLRTALTGLLPQFAGVPAVFYHVPQQFDDSQPYVTIYQQSAAQDDTDNTTGLQTTMTVHTWVQERTTIETGALMQAIYSALHRDDNLTVTGYYVSGIDCTNQTILRDPDGVTQHGVLTFTINYEPAVTYPPCN